MFPVMGNLRRAVHSGESCLVTQASYQLHDLFYHIWPPLSNCSVGPRESRGFIIPLSSQRKASFWYTQPILWLLLVFPYTFTVERPPSDAKAGNCILQFNRIEGLPGELQQSGYLGSIDFVKPLDFCRRHDFLEDASNSTLRVTFTFNNFSSNSKYILFMKALKCIISKELACSFTYIQGQLSRRVW